MEQKTIVVKRNYSVDFLRILATTFIVFHHYQQFTGAEFKYINFYLWDREIFYFGWIVEFFFLLSGYYTYKYVKEIYRGGMNFKGFISKKAIRLLPMVAIATLVIQINFYVYFIIYNGAGFGPIEHVGNVVSLWKWLIATLGIDTGWIVSGNSYVTWYISVLMLCYVLFYMATYAAKRIKVMPEYIYAFIVLIGVSIRSNSIELPFLNQYSARGYYAFFFGILFAKYMGKIKSYRWIQIGSVFVVCGIMLSHFFYSTRCIISDGEVYILTFLFYPALLIIADFPWMQKVFKYKIIGILGESSFDVYVWHMPMLVLLYNLIKVGGLSINTLSWKCMIGFTFVMWIIGVVSYYGIERKISSRFSDKLKSMINSG